MYTEVACAQCRVAIVMTQASERHYRDTHKTFYCPNGHSNYFPGKTQAEKRIEELEQELLRANRREDNAWDAYEEARAEGRQCQWPGCRDRVYASQYGLREHMRRAHGMPRDKEFREQSQTSEVSA